MEKKKEITLESINSNITIRTVLLNISIAVVIALLWDMKIQLKKQP